MDTIEKIKDLIGSNKERGWPVAVRDRIAFPEPSLLRITGANVALTFLWTIRDSVVPFLEKDNLALATNFYTPAGLQNMVRNILSNPYIRYIIILGEEYSTNANELTSANAIRSFFKNGINKARKIDEFQDSVYFDKNIPLDLIEQIRKNVELIDLNKQFPNSSLKEKIEEANKLIKSLEKKGPFIEPMMFGYEPIDESFPYEDGPILVHGSTIPGSWLKTIYNIYKYGKKNLMNANTDRWIKEINNMIVVIHQPQDLDLSLNPFLIPLTIEKIEAYQKEILSSILPEGKAYTYGNKLRAYYHPNPDEIKLLVNTAEYKDFEFKQGPWLDKNIRYNKAHCEINQIEDIIDVLKRDPYSKACIALTWHVSNELMRKHKSSPCLVLLQAIVQDERLNLTVFFRSHDMVQGWPENAYGCAAIQKEISDKINIVPGILTIISGSAQIYNNYYQQVEGIIKKYHNIPLIFDEKGNFLIKIEMNEIVVSLIHPKNGRILEEFKGETALELKNKIVNSMYNLDTQHAIYLGSELILAQQALENNGRYNQDN